MAEWKKIIVSGSKAHLNQVTASNYIPFKINTGSAGVKGISSTTPLVYDGTTGLVGTGSAYAVQGGTDYVTGDSLTANHVIVGANGSAIKVADSSISFNGQPVTQIGSVTFNAGANVGGTDTIFFNNHIAIRGDATKNQGEIVLKETADLEIRDAIGAQNSASISSSISTLFLYGDSVRTTPVIKYHANSNEAALTDRMIFEDANATRNFAIQAKPDSTANKAELAIVNNASDIAIHLSGSRVGIGTLASNNSGLTFVGGLSGSGGAYIKDIHTDVSLDTDATFDKTLVYDSQTGRIAAHGSNLLGGVTGVTAGTNLNDTGTNGGAIVINLDTSLNALSDINVTTVSGSNILLEGSGSNDNDLPTDNSRVRVTHVSASNLLVKESAQFDGTFLFSGFDFQVQNAIVQSGSNVFGSGSLPSDVFHTFTGSVDITGSLTVDGPVDFNNDVNIDGDLTVDGYTDLDDTGIDGDLNVSGSIVLGSDSSDTLTVNAVSTFNENVTLATANLNVGGAITGSTLRLTNNRSTAPSDTTNFLIRSSSGDIFEASSFTLEDISITAGPGINVNGQTISVNSSSMAEFFASHSFDNVSGDVLITPDNDGTFTSTIQSNAVEDSMIDFIDDSAGSGIADGQILVGSGSVGSKQFFKRSLTGVIAIDSEGVTSFTEAANIDTANQASASLISSASAGDHSILLTDSTNGGVTQSLKVDGNSSDFKYNTNTNVLTVGGSTFGENVSIAGNLTVLGDTVTLNTETLTVEDNFIQLNSNLTDASVTTPGGGAIQDAGISINRGNQATASLFWDESANRWGLSLDASPASNDADPELNADAYLMFVYTANADNPPVHVGADDDDGWGGYGSSAASTKEGAMFIANNGDIFIYA